MRSMRRLRVVIVRDFRFKLRSGYAQMQCGNKQPEAGRCAGPDARPVAVQLVRHRTLTRVLVP